MGIAHPPGYPLFTMLANIMHKLPFGSPAWRINLLSVLLSTASAWYVRHPCRAPRTHSVTFAKVFECAPLVTFSGFALRTTLQDAYRSGVR